MAENEGSVNRDAGWYPDPDRRTPAVRWWDGSAWTEARHDPSLPPPPPLIPNPPPGPPSKADWAISIVLMSFCGVIGLLVVITNSKFTWKQKFTIIGVAAGIWIVIAMVLAASGVDTSQ
jgi:hypothetical protein